MGAVKLLAAKVPAKPRTPQLRRKPAGKPPGTARANLLQPALRVGAVNDPAEREAEIMASRVVASSTPSMADAPSGSGGQGDPAAAPLRRSAENQPNLDELQPAEPPSEQKDFDLPKTQDVSTKGLDKENTDELDRPNPVDTGGEAPAPESPPIEDAPPPVMPARGDGMGAVVGRSGGAAPTDVTNLVAHPGPGRALPVGLRNRLEPHFGTSFKDVRLHDGSADQRAARRIGARAFTHKNHIWLGQGESHTNTRLMAHELTHVVQQTKGPEALPLRREPEIRRGYFANKAESVARHVPGYTLITVLLGRTLISGKKVHMTAENLLGGFMGLIPGGTLMFDRLKEARVIQEAFDWVKGKLGELNLTWSRIKSDLSDALDTWNPFKAARNVKNMLVNLVKDIIRFVKSIAIKVLEFIVRGALKLAGPYADKVWGVIQQARDTIGLILEDPLGFAKNLIGGIVGGFKQFGKNILEHLKKGLLGWIFGSIDKAGITLPEKLDFKGLVSLALQILGITYENFRKQLVKKLGPNGEKKVSMIEKSVEIVKILLKEGFAGIWKKMLQMIDDFKKTFIGGMTKMVIKTVVEAGLSWLAGLSNPVGAIIKVVLAIYKLIVAFLERLEQIAEVAKSIFSSITNIAKGQVKQAADFIEKAIGRTIPVVLAFLAALLGLDGIPRRIREVINNLQKPVKKAMGKLIGFVVKKAKKLFSKLIKKLNGKRKLPNKNFKIGLTQHRIFAKKKGKKVEIHIASGTGHRLEKYDKLHKKVMKQINNAEATAAVTKISSMAKEAGEKTDPWEQKIDLNSQKKNQLDHLTKMNEELDKAAKRLLVAGIDVDNLPHASSSVSGTDPTLVRAAEPRSPKIEGKHGSYRDLQKLAKKNFSTHVKVKMSKFYELDHTIEKRFPKAIIENLHLLSAKEVVSRGAEPLVRATTREGRNIAEAKATGKKIGKKSARRQEKGNKQGKSFGLVGKGDYNPIPETAPAFPAIGVYHGNHIKNKGKGLTNHEGILELARDQAKKDAAKNKTPDPHAHVRSSIKKQLDAELDEMQTKFNADKSVTKTIRSNLKQGLADAKAKNDKIYDLKNVTARTDTAKEAGRDDFKANLGTSIFSFDGTRGSADFLGEEGQGGEYSSLPKGKGKFYENDHIIDKAYVFKAQGMKLLTRAQQKKVMDKGTKAAKMGKLQGKRMSAVSKLKMFAAGSAMQAYTKENGHAVTLYRPVAAKVTADTNAKGGPKQVLGYSKLMPDESIDLLAEHVRVDDESKRDKAIEKMHAEFKKKFVEKSDYHSRMVAKHYRVELATVPKINVHGNRAKAEARMVKIMQNMSASLATARTKTEGLFS
ncbi:MAG: DUF4157 domain-containing protein [Rhodobacteraceae bacterium]|nr:DUF4157 domain-containing protein [Paracoccaceae bacterium]